MVYGRVVNESLLESSTFNKGKWNCVISNELESFQMCSSHFKWARVISNELESFHMSLSHFIWARVILRFENSDSSHDSSQHWCMVLITHLSDWPFVLDVFDMSLSPYTYVFLLGMPAGCCCGERKRKAHVKVCSQIEIISVTEQWLKRQRSSTPR